MKETDLVSETLHLDYSTRGTVFDYILSGAKIAQILRLGTLGEVKQPFPSPGSIPQEFRPSLLRGSAVFLSHSSTSLFILEQTLANPVTVIRTQDNQDRNMNNSVHSLVYFFYC
jgi:hypothetical protein